MRPLLALLAAAVLCLPVVLPGRATPAPAYQHIANGGFEADTDGWSAGGGVLAATDAAETPPWEGAHTGALTTGGSGSAWMRYAIADTLAEGPYSLQLVARTDLTAELQAVAQIHTGSETLNIDAGSMSVGDAWLGATWNFALPEPGAAAVLLKVTADAGTVVFIDAVALDGASPATLTPVASSTAALTPEPTATVSPSPTRTATPRADEIGPSLRNAGFEEEWPDGVSFAWEKQGGTLSIGGRARSGTSAAVLESDTYSTKWIHQAVTVDGGDWYEFSAFILDDDAGVASVSLRLAWYASADASGSQIATDDSIERLVSSAPDYRRLTTGSVEAPAEARSARVRVLLAPVSSARTRVRIDDALFGAALPPTTVTATPSAVTAAPTGVVGASLGDDQPYRPSAGTARVQGATRTAPPPEGARLVLNEVLYDPTNDGADADSEWVELHNPSGVAVSLEGWSIADGRSADALPAIRIEPRGFAIVAPSVAFAAAHPGVKVPVAMIGSPIGNGLRNDGDVLVLIDPTGVFVDAISWGDNDAALDPPVDDVGEGHSIERRTAGSDIDMASDWVDNDHPTPGEGRKPRPTAAERSAGRVYVIPGEPGRNFGWLPWLMASASLAVLAGTAGWRVFEMMRTRQS